MVLIATNLLIFLFMNYVFDIKSKNLSFCPWGWISLLFSNNFKVLFLFNNVLMFLCVWVFCLHVYLCTMCVCGASGEHKSKLDSPELELQMTVSCRVGAGSQTQVPCKSSCALYS